MKFYQELTILPDPEINGYFIWQKLFTQIHLALVEHAKAKYGENATEGDIGVSFPDYKYTNKDGKEFGMLGNKLRIFANTENDLTTLNLNKWLERLTDYVHIKSVQTVPVDSEFLVVKRARQIKNLDQVARRRQKHQEISFDKAKANIIQNYAKKHSVSHDIAVQTYENPTLKAYPYINMQSLNSSNRFSLKIMQRPTTEAINGKFNTYGLSATSTVPHWEKSST